MAISVRLQTGGATPAGTDINLLREDIAAEIDSFAKTVEAAAVSEDRKPAPDGAQGDFFLVDWIIEIAKDPVMYGAYIRIFLRSLNSIVSRGQEEKSKEPQEEAPELDLKKGQPSCTVKIGAKEITLPASIAAIKKFVEELGDSP